MKHLSHIDWLVCKLGDHLILNRAKLNELTLEAGRSESTSSLYIGGHYGYLIGNRQSKPQLIRRPARNQYMLSPAGWRRYIDIQNREALKCLRSK